MDNQFIDSSNVIINVRSKQINSTVEFNNKDVFKSKSTSKKKDDEYVSNNVSVAEQMSNALREHTNYKKTPSKD